MESYTQRCALGESNLLIVLLMLLLTARILQILFLISRIKLVCLYVVILNSCMKRL